MGMLLCQVPAKSVICLFRSVQICYTSAQGLWSKTPTKSSTPSKIEARMCYSKVAYTERPWRKKNKPYPSVSGNLLWCCRGMLQEYLCCSGKKHASLDFAAQSTCAVLLRSTGGRCRCMLVSSQHPFFCVQLSLNCPWLVEKVDIDSKNADGEWVMTKFFDDFDEVPSATYFIMVHALTDVDGDSTVCAFSSTEEKSYLLTEVDMGRTTGVIAAATVFSIFSIVFLVVYTVADTIWHAAMAIEPVTLGDCTIVSCMLAVPSADLEHQADGMEVLVQQDWKGAHLWRGLACILCYGSASCFV
eukprot:1158565-Pelagomonas_calceolata.AAC.6